MKETTSLDDLRTSVAVSRRSLSKIGEGDWTPQDLAHLRLVQVVENFLATDPKLRSGQIIHGDAP